MLKYRPLLVIIITMQIITMSILFFPLPAFAYFQSGLNCEITEEGLDLAEFRGSWWMTTHWGLRTGYNWGTEDLYVSVLHKDPVGAGLSRYVGLGFGDLLDSNNESLPLKEKLELTAGLEADLGRLFPGFSAALEIRVNPINLWGSSPETKDNTLSLGVSINYRFYGLLTDRDLYLLAQLITAEAQGEPYAGQVAVGAVVMNRVKSTVFPNTIREVIYQKNQFSCLPKLPRTVPTESAMQAAKEAFGGKDPSQGALYYYNPRLSSLAGLRFFATADLKKTVEIGNHIFFK